MRRVVDDWGGLGGPGHGPALSYVDRSYVYFSALNYVSYRHGCIWGYCSNYEPVHVLLELERNLCSDSFLSCIPLALYQIHFCLYVAGGVVNHKKL